MWSQELTQYQRILRYCLIALVCMDAWQGYSVTQMCGHGLLAHPRNQSSPRSEEQWLVHLLACFSTIVGSLQEPQGMQIGSLPQQPNESIYSNSRRRPSASRKRCLNKSDVSLASKYEEVGVGLRTLSSLITQQLQSARPDPCHVVFRAQLPLMFLSSYDSQKLNLGIRKDL